MSKTSKKEKVEFNSLQVILYYMIGNTDLENVSEAGWNAYRAALELVAKDFTLKEEKAVLKKLLDTGWKNREGLKIDNWKDFTPTDSVLETA